MSKIYTKDIKKIKSEALGSIKINGKELKGAELKNAISETVKGGKTPWQIEKKLKELGVGGNQCEKRKKILSAISGDRKDGLTEKQVRKNLRGTIQRDESALEERHNRTKYSILGNVGDGEKGTAQKRLGITRGNVGFAGITKKTGLANQQASLNKNNPNNLTSNKLPGSSGGIKPLGF